MPTMESAIVTAAKRLARAQVRRRAVRKQLRDIEQEIKIARKELRAIMISALDNPEDQLPPRNARQIKRRQKP